MLGGALLLRIALAATPGYAGDRDDFIAWATVLERSGPLAIYGPHVSPLVDYTPGYLYVLWAAGAAHAALGGGAAVWRVLLEIVPIGSDMVLLWLLYRIARRMGNERSATILLAVAAFAPPLWLDSAIFGQPDALPIALALVALACALDERFVASWTSIAVAVVFKPLVIVIGPAIAVLHARSKSLLPSITASVACAFALAYVSTLPFTTERSPSAVYQFLLQRYANGAAKAPHATEGAFSVYPLVTGFFTSDATRYGPFSLATWGIALVATALVASALSLARSLARDPNAATRGARVFGAACLALLSLFLFATRMHERYLLPALVIGSPLALDDAPTAAALGWLAISFTLNCTYTLNHFTGGAHHPITITLARLCCALNLIAYATLWHRQTHRLKTLRNLSATKCPAHDGASAPSGGIGGPSRPDLNESASALSGGNGGPSRPVFYGGKETRTPDPHAASVMLYQLSYAPAPSRPLSFAAPYPSPFSQR